MKRFLMAVMAIALVACNGDSTGPDGSIDGTYTLRTVNGSSLPAVLIQVPGYRLEVLSGSVTINDDGTYSDIGTFREVEGTTTTTFTESAAGTWIQNGNTVTFRDSESGEQLSGTIIGDNLTQIVQGFTLVFER